MNDAARPASTPADGPAKDAARAEGSAEKNRYRATLNLPKTAFPMKASLVQNEPASVKRWQAMGLYERVRGARRGSPRFVFHDGPPYANGNLHLGHLLNRVLKDIVVRSRTMMGFDCAFVPGWDCHGLPIEHKVMTDLKDKGKLERLAAMPEDQRKVIVRRECAAHAEKFQKLQRGQMERFLTLADYDHPYLTMQSAFEGATLEVLASLVERGVVYRALKPVHWSIANETALAEAELEYEDREDLSVYVDFEAADKDAVYDAFGLKEEAGAEEAEEHREEEGEGPEGEGAAGAESAKAPAPGTRPMVTPTFMIWTTTPWTLPANLAIAVNPKFEYACVWVDGNVTVMAAEAVERVTRAAKAEQVRVLARAPGRALIGLRYVHPFVGASDGVGAPSFKGERGSGAVFRVVGAEYVTLEDGTGLVHTAPGHGVEDFQTGRREGLPAYCPVRGDGTYDGTVPEWLRGMDIWKANDEIARRLRESGHMFYSHRFTHSYPHDWRSKTPVIFRCTEQWFVSVDAAMGGLGASLKGRALTATDPGAPSRVEFVPEWGRNRMRGMLESRPDWCISRQRAWGMPIPAFELPDGTMFMSPASVRAVARVVREKGTDAWFTLSPADLLRGYDAGSDPAATPSQRAAIERLLSRAAPSSSDQAGGTLKKSGDILDVWFESGSTWAGCIRERFGAEFVPVDLYLEGSDQHRGWFQSSLLTCLGVTGNPPYKTLLTHGFIVDKDGKKLSKSRPDAARYEVESLAGEFGMDVMRWWVASLSYENDIKADVEFFAEFGESYRKVRNTLRFMLSNLYDAGTAEVGDPGDPAPTSLEAWILSRFDAMATGVVRAYEGYDFRSAQRALYDFCNDDLSAIYLAAVKDRLYCDRPDSPRRRATQGALRLLTDGLCRLLAPVMCHTADEAHRALRAGDDGACVHLELFPVPGSGGGSWAQAPGRAGFGVACDAGWEAVHAARGAALRAMERARSEGGIENPLDMEVTLPDAAGTLARFDTTDLADLLGVSRVRLDAKATEPSVRDLRQEPRCERSWKRDGTVKRRSDGGMLSDRDAAAIGVT